MSPDYPSVIRELQQSLGADRVQDSYHRRFAHSTDASYFRIVPEVVVEANTLEQVKQTLAIARRHGAPVTFRAAGTSLSGQAVGPGILLKLGYDGFDTIRVSDDHGLVTLGVAVIGAQANSVLKPLDKKIGPDPATLTSAKIGGIVANNSSGMCCGTAQNSYNTIHSAKLLFADGTHLDTASEASRAAFASGHGALLDALQALAQRTQSNEALAARIRKKFSIKNTTGYSLNALVDFTDPFDLINHLIVGSEGTLAFVEEVTYQTVVEARFKASALAVFFSMEDAAKAIPPIIGDAVAAAELLDWASIRAVTGRKGMPGWLADLPEEAAILLIESRASDEATLAAYTQDVIAKLSHLETERPIEFTSDPAVFSEYWAMRSGLFPIVGGERPKGTSVIIEDVAFDVQYLAAAVADLQQLFQKHGYCEGVIFGHALAGNFHFIITPKFATEADVRKFDGFMQDVATMVIDKYDGSMKAEHGTGRAVAPFVEREWGAEAYRLMKDIKQIFDPQGLLNPGVLLNDDLEVHIKQMKISPAVDDYIDNCIECGFCESTCPTKALNVTPRQRITTLREIARLEEAGSRAESEALRADSRYDVVDTCAACLMCTIACPVDAAMGKLTRKLRTADITPGAQRALDFQAKHYGRVNQTMNLAFDALHTFHKVAGDGATGALMKAGRAITRQVPYWNPDFPRGGKLPRQHIVASGRPKVVYFASCGARTFGPTPRDPDQRTVPEVLVALIERAGFELILPDRARDLCCGQMWESKGDFRNADGKRDQLLEAVLRLSEGGRYPVIVDALSCTKRTLDGVTDIDIVDAVDFIHDQCLPKLTLSRKRQVALHVGCSARTLNLEGKLQNIAQACAEDVVRPQGIECCAFAGEKGLFKPEMNASALRNIRQLLPEGLSEGYYANRMCELGLTHHSGISYRHVAYLVEECSRP